MKKFKFTLQTVHNVREMRQEKEQMRLMQLQTDVNKAAERVREIQQMRLQAVENYVAKLNKFGALDALELELSSKHLSSLDRTESEAQKFYEQTKQIAAEQSRRLAAATREVKITEKLRETQQQRHAVEMSKTEQITLDEIVCANFARQMS